MKKTFSLQNIKTAILITLISTFSLVSKAQSDKEVVDLYQAAFGMEKKELVSQFLKLEVSDPFWAVYDQYETERKALGQKRIDLMVKYIDNFGTMTDADIDAIMKEMMTLKSSNDKLIDTYYGKVKKVSGSKVSAQFYEIENFILSAIRLEIMSSIPFIGELED